MDGTVAPTNRTIVDPLVSSFREYGTPNSIVGEGCGPVSGSEGQVNTFAIGSVIFACCFGAAVVGMVLHNWVPVHHIDGNSRDVVKLVMAHRLSSR